MITGKLSFKLLNDAILFSYLALKINLPYLLKIKEKVHPTWKIACLLYCSLVYLHNWHTYA